MPSVNPRQFGKYTFFGYKDPVSKDVLVSGHDTEIGHQVAGFVITNPQSKNNEEQKAINNGEQRYGVLEDEQGQMRWVGGNFEPSYPHVSWMAVDRAHRNPTLLAGLAGLGVHLHGDMPYSDFLLTPEGADISRQAKEWGIRPHPVNPNMESNASVGVSGGREALRPESMIRELTTRHDEWDQWDDEDWEDLDELPERRMTDDEWAKATDLYLSERNAHFTGRAISASAFGEPGAYDPDTDISVAQAARNLRNYRPVKEKTYLSASEALPLFGEDVSTIPVSLPPAKKKSKKKR